MDDELKNLITTQLKKLPEHIRAEIDSFDWAAIMTDIGGKYTLSIEQMGAFQTETMLVLIGLSHPEEYAEHLKQKAEIPAEKIPEIVAEANERIFKSIRQSLADFVKKEKETEEANEKQTLNPSEQSILKKTGVEFDMGQGGFAAPQVPEPMMSRKEMLADIEHPLKTEPTFIAEPPHPLETKLVTPAATPKTETEYQKENKPDPYREIPS